MHSNSIFLTIGLEFIVNNLKKKDNHFNFLPLWKELIKFSFNLLPTVSDRSK